MVFCRKKVKFHKPIYLHYLRVFDIQCTWMMLSYIFHSLSTLCAVPKNFNIVLFLYFSFVRVIRRITNKKYTFLYIYYDRFSPDNHNSNPLDDKWLCYCYKWSRLTIGEQSGGPSFGRFSSGGVICDPGKINQN